MKKLLLASFAIILNITIIAQTPAQFNYQAALRDGNGMPISNQPVTVVIEIVQGSPLGESLFTETHEVTTNSQGIINLIVGSIEDLTVIEWGDHSHFIKLTVDEVEIGISQLTSVPYAFHAQTAKNFKETDPEFSTWDKSSGIVITESQITDLKDYLLEEADPMFTHNFIVSDAIVGEVLRFDGDKFTPSSQQTLSITGNEISISDGNTISLPEITPCSNNVPILTTTEILELTPEIG